MDRYDGDPISKATAPAQHSELTNIKTRIVRSTEAAAQLFFEIRETADQIFGPAPRNEEERRQPDAPGELQQIQGALDVLESRLQEAHSELSRLKDL